MKAIASLACGLLLLAGCTSAGAPSEPAADETPQLCKAGPAQFSLGEELSEELVEAVRSRSGAVLVRVLRAGEAATMEFNPERLNLHVDAEDRVTDARCG
ncbi:MAG: I78 family peptidase inhibitor [Pseudomonadota bacterium]